MGNYDELKGTLKDLLQKMEISSAETGMAIFDDFVKDYEASLYNEIGRLTRHLHDSLTTFKKDEKIFRLTSEDIPSAKERLRYVVDITEKAAQKTIGIIEKSIPLSLEISQGANDLHEEWTKISGSPGPSDISGNTKTFLMVAKNNAAVLHGCLTDIMIAQEYQDISGQIIKKVIDLVQDVENNLVRLVKLTGHVNAHYEEEKSNIKASGPRVPGVDEQVIYTNGQDDVDELLASLGF